MLATVYANNLAIVNIFLIFFSAHAFVLLLLVVFFFISSRAAEVVHVRFTFIFLVYAFMKVTYTTTVNHMDYFVLSLSSWR